mgnify:CR=1 FL=1
MVAIACTFVFLLAAKFWHLFARSLNAHPNFPDAIMREAAQRFRDEFKPAFEAWLAQVPEGEAPPGTPLEMPEYAPESRDQAEHQVAGDPRQFQPRGELAREGAADQEAAHRQQGRARRVLHDTLGQQARRPADSGHHQKQEPPHDGPRSEGRKSTRRIHSWPMS